VQYRGDENVDNVLGYVTEIQTSSEVRRSGFDIGSIPSSIFGFGAVAVMLNMCTSNSG